MSTIDDIVLQMKILTNKITVFRSTITTDMTTESQARINYDEYLRDLVQGLQDQISSIDITNNTAGILDVINAVSTAIDSHQLVLSPQATIRAIKRIAPLNGGTVNITEDANNIFIHGEGNGISRQRIVRYTKSATLKLSDANCIIECDSTDLIVLTVPTYDDIPFKSAVLFDIVQINTGGVQVVGASGVTIEANGDGLGGIDTSGLLYLSTEPNRFIFSIAGGSGVPDGGTTGQALLKQSNDDGDATWQTLTKSLVGLSNVDNTPDLNKPVSVDQAAADTATLNSAKTYADVGDLATLNSAKAYTDAMTTGLLQFIGNWSASGGLYPTTGGSGSAGAVVIGDVWRVSVAGTMGGVTYRIGDSFYATSNTPAQDPTKWASILLELGYNPEDVANKVTAFSSPTNAQYPSALLVKTQLDLKINDVTNGTGTGVTQVRTPVAGTREIARIAAASTDVVVTQGAAGAPNTIGLNGTTLKYWDETSVAHASAPTTTQVLTWKPKTPNGTFVDANTILNIPVKAGLTLRDPAAANFPVNFVAGLDLQYYGGSDTYARSYGTCVGYYNRAGFGGIAVGTRNTCGYGAAGAYDIESSGGQLFGSGNQSRSSVGSYAQGTAVALGTNNVAGSMGVSVGNSNSGVASGAAGCALFGNNNGFNGYSGVAIGLANSMYNNVPNAPTVIFGSANSNTGIASANNTIVGLAITSTNQVNSVLVGKNITATAPTSTMFVGGIATNTDQGINQFQQFGRNIQIPLVGYINAITDWTNTAWRDVPNSTLLGTGFFKAKFVCSLGTYFGEVTPYIPNRIGIISAEYWIAGGGTQFRVLDGGDANFLTYFDFQFVTVSGGVKLQVKLASDPSGGSPNQGTLSVAGILTNTAL